MHGHVLGGGLEIALAAHFRVAQAGTKFGLPEVTLGIIPGAGGTQRLPRLIPMEHAIRLVTTGARIETAEAFTLGLLDLVRECGDARVAGLDFARKVLAENIPVRRTGELPVSRTELSLVETATAALDDRKKENEAALFALKALEGAAQLTLDEGLANERALFLKLFGSPRHRALVHAFLETRSIGQA